MMSGLRTVINMLVNMDIVSINNYNPEGPLTGVNHEHCQNGKKNISFVFRHRSDYFRRCKRLCMALQCKYHERTVLL